MKRASALVLCILLSMQLVSCAAKQPSNPTPDTYVAVSAVQDGKKLSIEEIFDGGLSLSLLEDGSAALAAGGDTSDGEWTLTDDVISLHIGEQIYEGTLENDVLILSNPEDAGLSVTLRKTLGNTAEQGNHTGLNIPVTALTLEDAMGDAFYEPDFVSPTKKLSVGMQLHGVMHLHDIVDAGVAQEGTMTVDVWGWISEDVNGKTFFEVFDAENFEGVDPLLSLYINLKPRCIEPVIGEEDAWIAGKYLTPDDAECFTIPLENGALHITYPYSFGEDNSYTIEIFLREKGTPWDERNDPYRLTGLTMDDLLVPEPTQAQE